MVLFAETLSAVDAFACGFVSKILPHGKFAEDGRKMIEKYENLSAEVI